MVFQPFYWPGIRNSPCKEFINCDTLQRKKLSNKHLPAKESEEISRNKLCVYIIGPYVIERKGKKETLNIKAITMITTVTGCFRKNAIGP